MGEERLQDWSSDRGVRAHDAEEGCHVGVDHASALGHTGEGIGCRRGGWKGEGRGEEFGEGVGGADGASGGEPGVVCVGQGAVGCRDTGEDLSYREPLPDHAGGHHERAAGRGRRVEARVDRGAHADRIFETSLSRDGIGTARVDDNGVEAFAATFLEGLAADRDRGGLKFVFRKDGSARAGGCRCDEGQVRKASIGSLHADIGPRYLETLWVGAGTWNVFLFRGRN